jgi:hypothetical protein
MKKDGQPVRRLPVMALLPRGGLDLEQENSKNGDQFETRILIF